VPALAVLRRARRLRSFACPTALFFRRPAKREDGKLP